MSDPLWSIDESRFPSRTPGMGGPVGVALPSEQLRFLLRYAILAPSGHNTQPWLFDVEGRTVRLYADRSRRLPIADPQDRELTISCGAALGALRIAMKRFGLADRTTLTPSRAEPDLLAEATIVGPCEPTFDDVELCRAIPLRRTNRRAYRPESLPAELLARLVREAESEGAWLHLLAQKKDLHTLAEMVGKADRKLWHEPRWRDELSRWVRPNLGERHDGIPLSAQGKSGVAWDLISLAAPWIVRHTDPAETEARHDEELVEHTPVVGVLGTPRDGVADWLRAGMALMRVCLRARLAEVWTGYVNQPMQVAETRMILGYKIGRKGPPQVVLRLGRAEGVDPTPRRPVSQVMRRQPAQPAR